MLMSVGLLLASAGAIYLFCELFVNGVEWMGRTLGIGRTATGSILAAFGTALPESVVTLVATAFGAGDAERQIGIGAALGGPLALSTLAYGVVGLCLVAWGARTERALPGVLEVDGRRLSRDQAWFLAVFAVKIALGVTVFAGKSWLGIVFLAAYGAYFWTELRRDEAVAGEEEVEPLLIRRHDATPHIGWILAQTLGATVVIFVASHIFVGRLTVIAPWLGLPPQVTALLLSPIATELPEMMNALIWVRQGKERLALANISGAMMIQATIPTAFGLFFTPWILDRTLLVAAGVTALAIACLLALFRRGRVRGATLARVGWLYALFGVLALAVR